MRRSSASRRQQPLPVREEASERVLLDRFHLAPEPGKRFAADLAKDFCVTPLSMQTSGPEAAFKHTAFLRKLSQSQFYSFGIQAESFRRFARGEWSVSAGVAANEFEHRVRNGFEQRDGKSRWQWNAQGIAVSGGIFGGNEAFLTGDAQVEQASCADEAVNMGEPVRRNHAACQLFPRKVTEFEAQIVDAVG